MRVVLVAGVLVGCGFEHGRLPGTGDGAIDDTRVTEDVPLGTPRDCLEAFQQGISTDGIVMIDPDGQNAGAPPLDVYCDMTTDGGGWTLVYVYAFADFANFDLGTNAATPRPDWPLTTTETTLVPISTQVPLSPTTLGAMPFARWQELGHQMLATSNINHWLRCTPAATNGGEIVTTTTGDVTCTIIELVATACTTEVPTYLSWFNRGPTLLLTATGFPHYYYWEASTAGSWPTHDPCGANGTNHLTNVVQPRGAIWLRR